MKLKNFLFVLFFQILILSRVTPYGNSFLNNIGDVYIGLLLGVSIALFLCYLSYGVLDEKENDEKFIERFESVLTSSKEKVSLLGKTTKFLKILLIVCLSGYGYWWEVSALVASSFFYWIFEVSVTKKCNEINEEILKKEGI